MASWVFCNRCFQPPHRKSSFSLTSCGHVYCDACLCKGRKDECMICKVPCRTVLLTKHTDSSIQAFFMGIDSLCKKYSQDTAQISEFQDKHRKRLLTFYREKISQLEESLRKSVLQLERLQRHRGVGMEHGRLPGADTSDLASVSDPGPQGAFLQLCPGCVSSWGPQHPGLTLGPTPSQANTVKALRADSLLGPSTGQVSHPCAAPPTKAVFPQPGGSSSSVKNVAVAPAEIIK
ncbi:RING finger protein 212 [Fukomys damarensis]|uniref:Probable E3 SUMO-protein ligase RNF212 n=1 Tax=Fukomys damarensis TaxID=885580 RepID=A0A091DSG2_FUKDA|nr:RING finger protein 212 [Fukomys damarensis]